MGGLNAREFERRDSDEQTTCVSQDRTFAVVLCNLSEGGCLLEGDDLALQIGARAQVRLADFGLFDGKVIWAAEGRGGIAFDEPLHNAVVRFIANRTSAAAGPDDAPRDRFGRILPPPAYPPRFGDILAG